MRKLQKLLFAILLLGFGQGFAQVVTTEPAFPQANQPVKIIFDASQGTGGLAGFGDSGGEVKMHSGVIITSLTGTEWEYVEGTWGNPDAPGDMTYVGNDIWEITITPNTYYAQKPENETIFRLGMVFREKGPCNNFGGTTSNPCKEAKADGGENIYVNMTEGDLAIRFDEPNARGLAVDKGEAIPIKVTASATADITITENGVEKTTATGATTLDYTLTASSDFGSYQVVVEGDFGSESKYDTFNYIIIPPTIEEALPANLTNGINYIADDSVILVLYAPFKQTVFAWGDFQTGY